MRNREQVPEGYRIDIAAYESGLTYQWRGGQTVNIYAGDIEVDVLSIAGEDGGAPSFAQVFEAVQGREADIEEDNRQ